MALVVVSVVEAGFADYAVHIVWPVACRAGGMAREASFAGFGLASRVALAYGGVTVEPISAFTVAGSVYSVKHVKLSVRVTH